MPRSVDVATTAGGEQQINVGKTLCFRAERFQQRRDVVEATASREEPCCSLK